MRRPKFLSFLPILSFLFLLASCATTSFESSVDFSVQESQPVRFCRFTYEGAKCLAARIDLSSPDIELCAWPDDASGWFRGKRTSAFARESGCIVAVNATPFMVKSRLSRNRKLAGLHCTSGRVTSPASERYASLCFYENDTRCAVESGASVGSGASSAFGGFFSVLENGAVRKFPVQSHDARTAAGVSDGGRVLWLLSCRKGKGLSYSQSGRLFLKMGCTDALQFDGGSSAQMCIGGRGWRLNPVVQANSFGFRKKPVPANK